MSSPDDYCGWKTEVGLCINYILKESSDVEFFRIKRNISRETTASFSKLPFYWSDEVPWRSR